MLYSAYKLNKQTEFENLNIGFAFSKKQFEEMKNEMNIKNNSELCSIGGGGFMKKSEVYLLDEWIDKYDKQFNENIKDDEFLESALRYELDNHEYCVTFDPTDALESLDMTMDDIKKDRRMYKIYLKVIDEIKNRVTKEKLIDYLLNNIDLTRDIVNEIISWNGELEYLEVFDNNEDFFNMLELDGYELACKVFYGDYNPNDDYVRLNAYENLESLSNYEYENELKNSASEILEAVINNYNNITIYNSKFDEMLKEYIENEVF